MTQKISLLTLSVVAAAAVAAERFVAADGVYAPAGGNTFGVSTTEAAIGELFGADVAGTTIVTAGGAIAKNAYVQVGNDGKAVTHTNGVAVAQALQAATAEGDRIEIRQIPNAPAGA